MYIIQHPLTTILQTYKNISFHDSQTTSQGVWVDHYT